MSNILKAFITANYIIVALMLPDDYVAIWAERGGKSVEPTMNNIVVHVLWPAMLSLDTAYFLTKER